MSPSKKIFTPTRLLVGGLLLVNVAFAVVLVQSSRRTTALEKRIEETGRGRGARPTPPPRAARRAGQDELGERRPPEVEEQPAAEPIGASAIDQQITPADQQRERTDGVRVTHTGRRGPPDDPEEAFDALLDRAKPSEAHERAMREAFDRFHPKAVAAYHADDEQGSKAAWQEYCDEVGRSVDEATLSRLGCRSVMTNMVAAPPPTPEAMGIPPAPPVEVPPPNRP